MVQAVEVAIRLLQMTAAAGHFLQENHLYKSFRLLQRVKEGLLTIRDEEGPQGRSAAAWLLSPLLWMRRACLSNQSLQLAFPSGDKAHKLCKQGREPVGAQMPQ